MGEKINLVDGELYWVDQGPGLPSYIAEYKEKNKNIHGAEAGPCFWVGIIEVIETPTFEIISHIPRPKRASA